MTEHPDKLDLHSQDIPEEKKQELLRLFPEIHTEGGKIDLERLKLAIGETVDVGKERYGMNWPGKADCFKTIQAPSMGTLRPCPEESVNFDTTENLIIEGDNLEVLKLLQKSYLGKIKMIYIDPPYNTGKEFIYPDNYTESLQTYLQYTGQVDSEGKKFSTNTEADGRFHSKWLNMMYPRLYLARNLLRDDGVIFISIDDNEVSNLRKLCDEIFGEENFVDCVIWKKRYGGGAKEKYLVTLHEYALFYAKNKEIHGELFIPLDKESVDRYYKLRDENYHIRGLYRTHPLEAGKAVDDRPNLIFPIIAPDGTKIMPERQWYWNEERVKESINKGEIEFIKGKNGWTVHSKQYLKDENGEIRQAKAFSIIDDVYSQHGTNEMIDIFGNAKVFSYPKPSNFLAQIINMGTNNDSNAIILDFFSGSATTSQAVLDLNKQYNGNRKFILVQLPEPCAPDSEAFKAGYKTIADIGKERIRREIKKLNEEDKKKSPELFSGEKKKADRGFRVFKLAESNFKTWNADIAKKNVTALEKQLELHIDHIRPDRSQEDILYEILIKSGFALTPPIEKLELAGMTVFSAAGGTFIICLERKLTIGVIEAMAKRKPERVVCLDEGFTGNDQLKANAVQIFKTKGVNFKTI
jgi:adenine-specific DNA-methyltransferase